MGSSNKSLFELDNFSVTCGCRVKITVIVRTVWCRSETTMKPHQCKPIQVMNNHISSRQLNKTIHNNNKEGKKIQNNLPVNSIKAFCERNTFTQARKINICITFLFSCSYLSVALWTWNVVFLSFVFFFFSNPSGSLDLQAWKHRIQSTLYSYSNPHSSECELLHLLFILLFSFSVLLSYAWNPFNVNISDVLTTWALTIVLTKKIYGQYVIHLPAFSLKYYIFVSDLCTCNYPWWECSLYLKLMKMQMMSFL